MQLETPRLLLRQMLQEDLDALKRIVQDEEVMQAYGHAFSDEEAQNWLLHQQQRYRVFGYGLLAAVQKSSGAMIGQCGLSLQDFHGRHVLEIGYLFQKAYWHQGYAIEAARACKAYAFDVLGAKEVYSMVRDTNLASMNVAIRNGMLVRGRFSKHYNGMDMPHLAFCAKNIP